MLAPTVLAVVLLQTLVTAAPIGDALDERAAANCPDYSSYSQQSHGPFSPGINQLSYQRPTPGCRTFNSSVVEDTIQQYKKIIKDPDLFWLFQNTFPNTLDTTIRWRGHSANDSTEELAFLITGDIDAMWLRDSANQMHAYASLLKPSSDPNSLASLFRGTINLQSRYIEQQPWCNSYQAPPESGIPTHDNGGAYTFTPSTIDMNYCFTPNFELDSFGSFFQVSNDYFTATRDATFFGRYSWMSAVQQIMRVARLQMEPFYNAATGDPLTPAYTFNSQTTNMGGTLDLGGLGTPVKQTGMIKAPFRPSDNSVLFQFLLPSNIMFAGYLNKGADIMRQLKTAEARSLAQQMKDMASSIQAAAEKYGVVPHPTDSSKKIYAFEVDGYGSRNLIDDANTPSLLSMPLDYPMNPGSQTYKDTRDWVLSLDNPWWAQGPVISGVGSSHTGIGRPWHMALITRIQTSDDDDEIVDQLKQLLSSTAGLGLMHESVNARNATDYTRQWFAWCNSIFGEMVLDLHKRKPHILKMSFQ